MSSTLTGDNRPPVGPERSGSKAGAIVLLIFGILAGLIGLAVLAAGVTLAAFNSLQSDDGFYTTPRTPFSVSSYALTSPRFDIAGDVPIPASIPFDLATFRLQATSADADDEIFIGIAPRADVERYLSQVHHSEIVDVNYRPFRVEYRDISGTETPEAPDAQDFWTESASGSGSQEITWQPQIGEWSVVLMNADASSGVDAEVVAGVHTDLLEPVAIGLIVSGSLLFLVGLALLIPGAIGLGRHAGQPQVSDGTRPGAGAGGGGAGTAISASSGTTAAPAPEPRADRGEPLPFENRRYPAYLTGEVDPAVSRWLWLVKWLLAIPHFIILAFLWFALLITTIVAGVAILFTGRYPRALFDFNVGVLRWNWRVTFYAYSALGTDQYPPFTLARTPYPADFDVEYPERLSNGLVLVKWWLLALPHLLIVGVLAGGTWSWSWWWSSWFWPVWWGTWRGDTPLPGQWDPDVWNGGTSLLGLLVLIAAVILLFTERYPTTLFNLIMGVNRWVYRVLTYVVLLRDEYPPFRLDQGGRDPGLK